MSAPALSPTLNPEATPSWRQQLRAKRRRRTVLPIQVSEDAGDLAATVARRAGAVQFLRDLPTPDAQAALPRAEADLAEARAALAEHTLDITFQALPADEWEALIALHPSVDPGDDGGIAWRSCLPAAAAACCAEDDSGRGSDEDDVAWWTETLAMECWTSADLLSLWGALLRLHTRAPSERLPFA